jgi:predicted transglutaminase-like cysteine proteinase
MRRINDTNNDKIKYFAVYKFDGPDGVSTTFDKHTDNTQKQILKFGDAAERLAKRKNKKLNRVEKRANRKMDKM